MKQFTVFTTILFLSLSLFGCGAGSSAGNIAEHTSPDSVTVGTTADVGVGVATLSWTPPTENTDNSYLVNLKGYRIYYGYTSDEVTTLLRDTDDVGANLTEYTVEGLTPGSTYYFGMTAVNDEGVESAMSNLVSKDL